MVRDTCGIVDPFDEKPLHHEGPRFSWDPSNSHARSPIPGVVTITSHSGAQLKRLGGLRVLDKAKDLTQVLFKAVGSKELLKGGCA